VKWNVYDLEADHRKLGLMLQKKSFGYVKEGAMDCSEWRKLIKRL